MKVITLGADSRCRHGEPLPLGEDQCDYCHWEEEMLSGRPPFRVKCTNDKDIDLKKDDIYTVVAVIRSGTLKDIKSVFPCFLLATENHSCATLKGYPIRKFELAK